MGTVFLHVQLLSALLDWISQTRGETSDVQLAQYLATGPFVSVISKYLFATVMFYCDFSVNGG
jgi:hypothetical protein